MCAHTQSLQSEKANLVSSSDTRHIWSWNTLNWEPVIKKRVWQMVQISHDLMTGVSQSQVDMRSKGHFQGQGTKSLLSQLLLHLKYWLLNRVEQKINASSKMKEYFLDNYEKIFFCHWNWVTRCEPLFQPMTQIEKLAICECKSESWLSQKNTLDG